MKIETDRDAWKIEVARLLAGMRDFAKEGPIGVMVTLWNRLDIETGAEQPCEFVIATMFNGEHEAIPLAKQHETFSTIVKLAAVAGDAFASLLVAEAWCLTLDSDTPPPDLSTHPDRGTALLSLADHWQFGRFATMARVDDDRNVGDWGVVKPLSVIPGLSRIVPPNRPDEQSRAMARAAYAAGALLLGGMGGPLEMRIVGRDRQNVRYN
jgi:hypothetical protein